MAMNRRNALMSMVAPALVMVAPSSTARKYGRLDVMGYHAHLQTTGETLHIFYQGEDITTRCSLADDVEGIAEIYCEDRDAHENWMIRGAKHIDGNGSVCMFRLVGDVRIVPGQAFDRQDKS